MGPFLTALSILVVAGFLQGTFVLPMTLTRKWKWEHNWIVFSILGMLVFNWLIAAWQAPAVLSVFQQVGWHNLSVLLGFGALWGVGAVLFGMGMDRLGMALGYPIIMGLILSLGALIPALQHYASYANAGGVLLVTGVGVNIGAIVICAQAASLKGRAATTAPTKESQSLGAGLIIAVLAGVFSALPNIGASSSAGQALEQAAASLEVSTLMVNNLCWVLMFSAGFVVNFLYCGFLLYRNKNGEAFKGPHSSRNLVLIVLMSLMWIGSFYVFGIAKTYLGGAGRFQSAAPGIIGWPIFISLSIVIGNLWGLWRGEWREAPSQARSRLKLGLVIVFLAIGIIASSSLVLQSS